MKRSVKQFVKSRWAIENTSRADQMKRALLAVVAMLAIAGAQAQPAFAVTAPTVRLQVPGVVNAFGLGSYFLCTNVGTASLDMREPCVQHGRPNGSSWKETAMTHSHDVGRARRRGRQIVSAAHSVSVGSGAADIVDDLKAPFQVTHLPPGPLASSACGSRVRQAWPDRVDSARRVRS